MSDEQLHKGGYAEELKQGMLSIPEVLKEWLKKRGSDGSGSDNTHHLREAGYSYEEAEKMLKDAGLPAARYDDIFRNGGANNLEILKLWLWLHRSLTGMTSEELLRAAGLNDTEVTRLLELMQGGQVKGKS